MILKKHILRKQRNFIQMSIKVKERKKSLLKLMKRMRHSEMKLKREYMTRQVWLEMSNNKLNKIHSEDLEVDSVVSQVLKDSKITLSKDKKDRLLLEIYLKSLRNFLEVNNRVREDRWLHKKAKILLFLVRLNLWKL